MDRETLPPPYALLPAMGNHVNLLSKQPRCVKKTRLAIIAGHPVQYVAPWLAQLAKINELDIHVFYLWDFGVVETKDPGFGITLEWDIPLLEGYPYSFVRNISADPGNHHFMGYVNPSLMKQVSAWKPDVIFLMNYAFLSYFLLVLDPRSWPIPILFRGDSHDVGRIGTFNVFFARWIRRIIFSRFSGFLDVGVNNRKYILASGVPRRKLFRAPHAIDNKRFRDARPNAVCEAKSLRERLKIRDDQTLISFVGKLIALKRPIDLVFAFANLPENLRERAALLFVGDGKLKKKLVKLSRNIGDDIHFLDFQNQSVMPSIYAASDLLVLPSQNETWGLVINEAMNLSCPVLVSDHVGCWPDLVIPDTTGWVYPTGNVQALNNYLMHAIDNPDKLRQMGINASEHVLKFSFESVTDGLLKAIHSIQVD
jgi:glycosyltransferase involved in cell wall biosynthesis